MAVDNDKVFDFNRLRALVAEAPGPSPWYYSERSIIPSEIGPLKWQHLTGEGCVALVDAQGRWRLLLGHYSYAMALSLSRMVVWYEAPETGAEAGVRIFLLEFSGLSPLEKSSVPVHPRGSARRTTFGTERILFDGVPLASRMIPISLKPGLNQFSFPIPFKTLPEMLVLADNSWILKTDATTNQSIYCLRPDKDEVEVLPQDWFNNGEYDFGYQWITKVARDSHSGRIVGTGMRLRSFVLDGSGRRIDAEFD